MSILLFDPTGNIAQHSQPKEHLLDTLNGKKVGYIFNQHASAGAFWQALEREVDRTLHPSAVHRIYKENTWAPAAKSTVDQLVLETDYALVGVGA